MTAEVKPQGGPAPRGGPRAAPAGDTIYALSSGAGTAAIAVIRVSGPAADAVLAALTGRPAPPARQAALRRLRDRAGRFLDEALVLRFAAGAGPTGEPVVELHCHGGQAVLRAVLEAIATVPGTRPAEPGEFTWRAFLSGRLDLAEVEALADLLAAETSAQHRQAARLMEGALHARAADWRAQLTRALALVEVTIDWADEEVPEEVGPEVGTLLAGVATEIRAELAGAARAERLRTGLEVALIGAPNAGKSSLLNALARREAALTSAHPGTTRDVIELRYDLDGLPVVFLDMAGLRETADPVEAMGVARARERAAAAELRLILAAPDAPAGPEVEALRRPGDLTVATKADLGPPAPGALAVSARTGEGIGALLSRIGAALGPGSGGGGLIAHRRQQAALGNGLRALERAQAGLDSQGAELVSEDIRQALAALEQLLGRVGVEEVLGEIFGSFCLGK